MRKEHLLSDPRDLNGYYFSYASFPTKAVKVLAGGCGRRASQYWRHFLCWDRRRALPWHPRNACLYCRLSARRNIVPKRWRYSSKCSEEIRLFGVHCPNCRSYNFLFPWYQVLLLFKKFNGVSFFRFNLLSSPDYCRESTRTRAQEQGGLLSSRAKSSKSKKIEI